MKKVAIIFLFFVPVFIQAQVLSCNTKRIKETNNEKWEKVDYKLRVYEFADSNILLETIKNLSFNPNVDTISKAFLCMQFKPSGQDTVIANITYLEKPYLLDDLKGCCLVAGHYFLITGIMPSFLIPTKSVASFNYLSHKITWAKYGKKKYEIEDMGDDSAPQWKIEYSGENVRLIEYFDIGD